MFAPLEVGDNPNPGKPAFGMIQDDGGFVLTTYETDDGAIVGEHWVSIISLTNNSDEVANRAPPNSFGRLTLPHRVKVSAGESNQIDLKLTTEDVKRYGVHFRD